MGADGVERAQGKGVNARFREISQKLLTLASISWHATEVQYDSAGEEVIRKREAQNEEPARGGLGVSIRSDRIRRPEAAQSLSTRLDA